MLSERDTPIPEAHLLGAELERTLAVLRANLEPFATHFPGDTTYRNRYQLRHIPGQPDGANLGWTTGFWTGMLWLAYEHTADPEFRRVAEGQVTDFAERLRLARDTNHHDMGFLYTLSCGAAYKLTGDPAARAVALGAANHLLGRFLPQAGIIQAWGDLSDPKERGRMIVDCLMNLPLLYWASRETGQPHLAEAALRHARQSERYLLRPDGSTYHTFHFDPESGAPRNGTTHQGAADHSCWARGQAWAIYGFALSFTHTAEPLFLSAARRVADYYLKHLPADGVPFWDLHFGEGSGEERDSSAAAIAVCGLLELAQRLRETGFGEEASRYEAIARRSLDNLVQHYSSRHDPQSNALLLHGVYAKPFGHGVDEANLWGDYFYLEALTRLYRGWRKPYWY